MIHFKSVSEITMEQTRIYLTILVFLYLSVFSESVSIKSVSYENNTAFGYHMKFGVQRAEEIRAIESQVSRIVGGSQTALGQFSFQAGIIITLTTGWTSVCGGSLISNTRILTAAHCWNDGRIQAERFLVVLGSVLLNSGGTRIETKDVTVHPMWNPQNVLYDIAIVRITKVDYSNNIQAIPLPSLAEVNNDFSGLQGTTSGYGKKTDAANINIATASLNHVEVPIISNTECQKSFSFPIHGSHLCTKGLAGKGTCDGDSGGPLSVVRNFSRILIGITSFGVDGGCQKAYPSVFTRVTSLLPWIQANL